MIGERSRPPIEIGVWYAKPAKAGWVGGALTDGHTKTHRLKSASGMRNRLKPVGVAKRSPMGVPKPTD
jgi:hypothetical protein